MYANCGVLTEQTVITMTSNVYRALTLCQTVWQALLHCHFTKTKRRGGGGEGREKGVEEHAWRRAAGTTRRLGRHPSGQEFRIMIP